MVTTSLGDQDTESRVQPLKIISDGSMPDAISPVSPQSLVAGSGEVPDWGRHILKMQSQQLEMMQNLLTRIAENKGVTTPSPLTSISSDPYGDLIRGIPNFVYDAEDDETFEAWFKRYGPVIDDRGYALSDDRKRNLIIDKLDKSTYKTYFEHVLPLKDTRRR
ncbi:hypothetical protein GCK32_012919 [Trichostrongylus colubriformis]|uniref:DUF7083 domain-containing protein n=1 Tax=Trichostrongylus colubriformis TaxID=6319 RepID=A0AAN8IAS6_TRICO